jgi:hypothetical protein
MSVTVTQQTDLLSFSGNLKVFEVAITGSSLTFELKKAGATVLREKYYPAGGKVTVDVKQVIERLLDVAVPTTSDQVTEQTAGVADFTATIDSETPIPFTVVKGGVADLDTDAATWLEEHLLSWQPGTKEVLTSQPEYIGIYTQAETVLKLIAYDIDGTNVEATYAILAADKLYTVRTDWAYIVSLMAGLGATENVFAWTIYVDGANYETQRQTYQLRAPGNDENIFVWANSLGGIDTFSATGSVDDNPKLDHKTAISALDLTSEYDVIENREFKQSTGYLDAYTAAWLKDFFYSAKKYRIDASGLIKQIAALTSDIVVSSVNDLTDYSFTYRLSENTKLLNLEREFAPITEMEGIEELFAGQIVEELAHTGYQEHLKILVRRPGSQIWEYMFADELQVPVTIPLKQEQLTGEVDGTNKTFTTSAPYVAGSISIFVNGLKQRGVTETSNTTVTLPDAPLNTGDFEDVVEAIYMQNN